MINRIEVQAEVLKDLFSAYIKLRLQGIPLLLCQVQRVLSSEMTEQGSTRVE